MIQRAPAPLLALLILVSACKGDDGAAGTETETEGSESTGEGTTGAESTTADATSGSGGSTSETDGTSDGTTGATGEGLRGILNFTFYAPDAIDDAPVLGMAGAYRADALLTDDLYALQEYQLYFPKPPAIDAIEEHAAVPFEWGKADAWTMAGNGIKLAHPEAGDALACLYLADGDYPIYIASAGGSLAPECAPEPDRWRAGAVYRMVLYGGDAFTDRIIDGEVKTPPALEVSAPDLSIYNLEVDTKADLALAWVAEDDADARILIRVWDQYGQMTSATATDDGAFTIPAANLAALSGGPGFLTIARERPREIPFEGGTIRVLPRYELWGYIDLIE
ncbi:MAG: hypothetical protein R3B09_15090 [Nannocystaceae bacterium]